MPNRRRYRNRGKRKQQNLRIPLSKKLTDLPPLTDEEGLAGFFRFYDETHLPNKRKHFSRRERKRMPRIYRLYLWDGGGMLWPND